ncbi:MAG TPA: PQQ-dependent sugar dehydrogenase, partial [Verrucomicrobiae bacterium]
MRILLPRFLLPVLLALALPSPAAEPGGDQADNSKSSKKPKDDKTPSNVSVADDPQTAIKKMRVTPGLKVEVWAAEPMIENAVSFSFDEQGRCYVAQTGRRRTSVFDIRNFREWVDADLGLRSPQERAEFLRKNVSQDNAYFMSALSTAKSGNFGDFNKDGRIDWHDLEVESESIRLLYPSADGSHAERAVTFADGFNSIVSGLGAGVMVHHGDVYYTCIPDVWKLRDAKGAGVADVRTKLQSNFGVHIAYGGHDMHGLKMGPDGKIYWTIADRGFAPPTDIKGYGFTTAFLRRTLPDSGAVYRCDPDGSNLEVVCVGLRNPQELAFDQFGNLFTVDNNADGGDKARVEYIVEGADYGWRYGWQHLPKLGAWNSEMLWGLAASNTALYSLPPVAHVTHGPAGFAYYPGTGLPERFNDHFFIADFPGGVRYFQVKPDGAGFTVDNPDNYLQDNKPDNMAGKLLWNLYPTDVDFPPGGGIAVLDWVYGWEKTGKGRIYRLHDPAVANDVAAAEVKKLLAEGMEKRTVGELSKLLGHRDQRVRLEAQWELAERILKQNDDDAKVTLQILLDASLVAHAIHTEADTLANVHGLWGFRQVLPKLAANGRRSSLSHAMSMSSAVVAFSANRLKRGEDYDQERWAQVVRSLGDKLPALQNSSNNPLFWSLTNTAIPRPSFFAAEGIGKRYAHARVSSQEKATAVDALITIIRRNADHDPYLRHAGVCALVNIGDTNAILTAARDGSASVRLAALLAMRRLEMPEVAMFLTDADPRLVLEAARAINDAPIEPAMPQLAALLSSVRSSRGNETPSSPASPSASLRTREVSLVTSTATEEFTLRRAINANFRLGKIEHAQNLVAFAETTNAPEALRVEALSALGDWPEPSGRDRVVGLWRPLPKREARAASLPMRTALTGILKSAPGTVRIAAIEAAAKLQLTDAAPDLHALVADTAADAAVRIAALRALAALK